MTQLTPQLEDLLQRYVDNEVNAGEKEKIEQLISADPVAAARLAQLTLVHGLLKGEKTNLPSPAFTQNVMASLDRQSQTSTPAIRNGIFLLAGVIIVVLIAVALSSAGVFNETTTLDLNQVGLTQRFIKQQLPTFSFEGKTVVNVIILLNIAIAFIVLDRAILKPFFQRRLTTHP